MAWGDLDDDPPASSSRAPPSRELNQQGQKRKAEQETAAQKKARAQAVAQEGWEALLEARKRPQEEGPLPSGSSCEVSLGWGELTDDDRAPKRTSQSGRLNGDFALELLLGHNQRLRVENGRRLVARSPGLWIHLTSPGAVFSSTGLQTVDLSSSGVSLRAMRAAVAFAQEDRQLGSHGVTCNSELWSGGPPRPVARGGRVGEAQSVEDALHLFDVMHSASVLGIPRLEQAAESLLFGGDGRVCDATALPLFAASFGKCKPLSSDCLRLLTQRGVEILRGRERQLGVLYATHPVAAVLVSGVYKAVISDDRRAASPASCDASHKAEGVLLDLLFGPGSSTKGSFTVLPGLRAS